jgi:hypothetical protein
MHIILPALAFALFADFSSGSSASFRTTCHASVVERNLECRPCSSHGSDVPAQTTCAREIQPDGLRDPDADAGVSGRDPPRRRASAFCRRRGGRGGGTSRSVLSGSRRTYVTSPADRVVGGSRRSEPGSRPRSSPPGARDAAISQLKPAPRPRRRLSQLAPAREAGARKPARRWRRRCAPRAAVGPSGSDAATPENALEAGRANRRGSTGRRPPTPCRAASSSIACWAGSAGRTWSSSPATWERESALGSCDAIRPRGSATLILSGEEPNGPRTRWRKGAPIDDLPARRPGPRGSGRRGRAPAGRSAAAPAARGRDTASLDQVPGRALLVVDCSSSPRPRSRRGAGSTGGSRCAPQGPRGRAQPGRSALAQCLRPK